MSTTATPTARYITLQVQARTATYADAGRLERQAATLARKHHLDVLALEDDILTAVYATMTDTEVAKALTSPVTRRLARAELTRRGR